MNTRKLYRRIGFQQITINAATTLTATFNIVPPSVPGVPQQVAGVAGNARAILSFLPPTSNGGAAITGYTATCDVGGFTASAATSPITVTGLTNGTSYNCRVAATNVVGTGPASAPVTVTPSAAVTLTLVSVQSRKTHGVAGTFDIALDTTQAINGAVSMEPRIIGAGHTLVFQFNDTITATGTVTPSAGSASAVISGTDVVVTLLNIVDNRRASVTLTGVNGTALSAFAAIGFLVGDVNGTRSVNSSDISAIKARSGQSTTSANFQFDVNATGAINASDISAVKARSGLVLP